MFKARLDPGELKQFSSIHSNLIPHRKKRFEIYDIVWPSSRKADKNKEIYNTIQPILDRSIKILRSNNITDFDLTRYCIEFHQRNCGFEKKKYQWSAWHSDDHAAINYRVYTILYYLRKDRTVAGGDLEYIIDGTKLVHEVTSGDILQFKGDVQHNPQATSGFGCRDIIAVFIKRK